jgi:hypothetical protein
MTIRYRNGWTYDAVLLVRTETMLRVALQGSDDVLELNWMAGTWVTEDCEPVLVDFAWSSLRAAAPVTEADCICSHDLAAHLIHLLYACDEETAARPAPVNRVELAAVCPSVVS